VYHSRLAAEGNRPANEKVLCARSPRPEAVV